MGSFTSSVGVVMWIWIFFAVAAIVAAILGIRWAKATGQFDEDIKYQIFNTPDDEIFQHPDIDDNTPEVNAKDEDGKK